MNALLLPLLLFLFPLWLACDAPSPSGGEGHVASEAGLTLEAQVAAAKVQSGAAVALTVTLAAPPGWEVALLPPVAEGLTVTPAETTAPLSLDGREQRVTRYNLSGPDGSYVISPGAARGQPPGGGAPQEVQVPPIFVDVGVAGPKVAEMAAFEAPPPPPPPEEPGAAWAWIVPTALGGAVAVAAGLWGWRRRRSRGVEETPAMRVRRRWQAVRLGGLDEPAQAVALSAVFREYLQERYGFPATAATTREVLAALAAQGAVPPVAHARLASVLGAADRLKYAREGGGEAFFAELDASLEAVLALADPAAGEGGEDA